jgi:DNA-binding response OmpR family regulator
MKPAGKIVFFAAVLGSLSGTLAADTEGFEKEKFPPEPALITRMRKQGEAREKQAEYDVHVAIPDIDAAERALDGLNNTVSNALNMADQTRRAEESSRGFFESMVIAVALLGAGIFLFRKLGLRIGFLFKETPRDANASSALAEEKSFSDFVTAFKVGPTSRRRHVSETASASLQGEPDKVGENDYSASGRLKAFFDGAPKTVAALRGLIQEISRAGEVLARQKLLLNLCEKIHELKCIAGLPEVLPVWQLSAALEGLVKQLSEKDRNVTPSTLRTIASAVDLLESLSVPGIRSDLFSNPPIRLLAVDDDALSRHAVSFSLKKALNKPDLAENGEAALALVSHIKYDAIFLDVQMPGMNGFETCSKIHGTELNRTTPVVFVTCQSDFDARAKSTLSGGIDLIGKPFLTFEITVKALTLALRGRLKPRTDAASRSEIDLKAQAVAKLSIKNATSLLIEKEQAHENRPATVRSSSSIRESRDDRRRDRRKRAQSMRDSRKERRRHEHSQDTPSKSNAEVAGAQGKQVEAGQDSLSVPANLVANAFLAHAPANIQTLQERLEEICHAPDDETRREILVDLYLAVHSLAAEANLAKLQTIFQLSLAVEDLLKTLLEGSSGSMVSSLSVVANTLELLHDFCDAELTSNLLEQPCSILVISDDPLARKNLQQAIQLPSANTDSAETAEACKLVAEKPFDLIFLDVQTGAETFSICSKLRENSKAKTPIVFVFDKADSEALLESIQSEADRLIQKSSSPVEVSLVALTSALGARFEQLVRANESSNQTEDSAPPEELAATGK